MHNINTDYLANLQMTDREVCQWVNHKYTQGRIKPIFKKCNRMTATYKLPVTQKLTNSTKQLYKHGKCFSKHGIIHENVFICDINDIFKDRQHCHRLCLI